MRNKELDGLRGLAALAVALGHCVTATTGVEVWSKSAADFPSMTWQQIAARMGHVAFPADAAVVVFFVLSGYVLWGSLMRRNTGSLAELLPYVISRAYRLLPVAIASALALGFLMPVPAIELVENALLLSHSMNGVIWSLQVEVIGSALIFAMFAVASKTGPWVLALFVVALLAAVFYQPHYLVLFLSTFAMGASLHYLPLAWFNHAWLGAAAYCVLILADLMIGHGLTARFVAFNATLIMIGSTVATAPRFLASRIAHFLGEISYPFYLFHLVGALLAHRVIDSAGGMPANQFLAFLLYAFLSIGIAIPMAYVVRVLVEKPGMNAGKDLALRAKRLVQNVDRKTITGDITCAGGTVGGAELN